MNYEILIMIIIIFTIVISYFLVLTHFGRTRYSNTILLIGESSGVC